MLVEWFSLASKTKKRIWENFVNVAVFTNKKYKHLEQTKLMRGTVLAC